MSRAKIVFYKENLVAGKIFENVVFEKVITATGLSKSQFTTLLYAKAQEVCRRSPFTGFAIVDRIDTITEVKK